MCIMTIYSQISSIIIFLMIYILIIQLSKFLLLEHTISKKSVYLCGRVKVIKKCFNPFDGTYAVVQFNRGVYRIVNVSDLLLLLQAYKKQDVDLVVEAKLTMCGFFIFHNAYYVVDYRLVNYSKSSIRSI